RGERRDRPAIDAEAHRTYANAFGQFLRVGAQALHPDIRAEMHVGSDPAGGFLAPNERGPFITRLFEVSDIRRLATVYGSTYGSAMELPIDSSEAASGGWVGEREARDDTDTPSIGLHRVDLNEQFAMPVVTQWMLDDADFDVVTWVVTKMADIIGRTENAAFVVGDGVKKPWGFLVRAQNATTQDDAVRKWGVPQYVPSGAAGGIPTLASGASDGDAFLTLISKLKKPYRRNAKFFMNRATEGMVSKMKDAEGRYIWTRGNMAEGVPSTLHGYPIELIEEMPDPAADALAIAYGDMAAAYTILDRPGIRVLRDDLTTKGKVKFYGYRRVGGDLTNSEALKFMRLSEA
ncbi:MAG: phage major capsid protein, partial [Pseudomonadota bacterium]